MKFLSKLFNFVKNKNYNILSEEKLTFTFKRKENILLVSCAIIFNYISIKKKNKLFNIIFKFIGLY